MEETAKVYTSIYFENSDELINEFSSNTLNKSEHYELRFDLFNDKSISCLEKSLEFMKNANIDYIFTYRSVDIDNIKKIYNYAMKYNPPVIDIDIGSYIFARQQFKNSKLMISYHGINNDNVSEKIDIISKFSPDIYKIALLYTDTGKFLDDLRLIYDFKRKTGAKLAFIPMGDNNSILRVFSAFLVSDVAYASYNKCTAPGQLSLSSYKQIFEIFKRKYV